MKERIVYFDYIKGFAIILIVIFHIYGIIGRGAGSIVYKFCWVIQLPLFIYVSGVNAPKNFTTLILKKKCIRLLIPLISFYIIWCIIDPKNIINFPLDKFKHGYWYLLVLFELMLLLYFTDLFYVKLSLFTKHCCFGGLLLLYLIIFPWNNSFNSLFCLTLFCQYYPIFLIGIYSNNLNFLLGFKMLPIHLLLFTISFYLFNLTNSKAFIPTCNIFGLLFFISLFKGNIMPLKKYIAKIGEYSMQIYLLHFIILRIFSRYIPQSDDLLLEFFTIFSFALLFILLIIIVSKLIKKNKITNLVLFGIQK